MPDIVINGLQSDYIPAMDRGLHYGDGIFETIAYVDSRLQFWSQHMTRMSSAAEKLGIIFPAETVFLNDIQQSLAAQAAGQSHVIKLILTRGTGERGYRSPAKAMPCRIVIRSDWPSSNEAIAEQGARLTLCDTQVSVNPQLAGIKHLNRLENVLARNEWRDEFDEGLMCDQLGHIIEATMSNVFAVRAGQLYTPLLDRCGVHGIMRQQLLEVAAELTISCRETSINRDELMQMDEIFLTNSVIGLWPVAEYAGRTCSSRTLSTLLSNALKIRADKYAHILG